VRSAARSGYGGVGDAGARHQYTDAHFRSRVIPAARPRPVSSRDVWSDRYARALGDPGAPSLVARRAPSAWVLARCLELPAEHLIVDVAGGDGRHALALAERGRRVLVVDFVEGAVAAAGAGQLFAARGTGAVLGLVADARALPLAAASLDALLVTNFLDRALFPHFASLLRRGGTLVAETFTVEHLALAEARRIPSPRSPEHLLQRGELRSLVAPLAVVAYREGLVRDAAGERVAAGVVAVRG
jgi:SAM-dependent methyltransferase